MKKNMAKTPKVAQQAPDFELQEDERAVEALRSS